MPSSLTLGFLGPTNLPNTISQAGGHPALFAFKLAIHDINSRTDLLPQTNLTFVSNNTNSDVGDGIIDTFWQCVYGNVIGIVGEYTSVLSQSVQYVARYYKVPQISYGATSTEFAEYHATRYPYFLRTTSDLHSQLQLLAYFIASQKWKNIAIMCTTDAQMFHSAQMFRTAVQKLGVRALMSVTFPTGASNITTQLQMIKQSQARIIVFIGVINDQQTVITNSLAEGLTGIGYQWIGIHASMYKSLYLNATGGTIQDYYQWAQGFIGLQNSADVNSPVYRKYAERWAATPPDPETPTITRNYISPIANFAYDACFMFAHALHHLIEVLRVDPTQVQNRELYLNVLKNVSFLGVSGNVSVDENGDRHAPFDIVNFQGDEIVTIGSIATNGQVTYLPHIKIMYTGGTTTKPLDLPVRLLVKISRPAQIGLIGGCVTCVTLCVMLIAFTCWFRQHSVIKASSSTFLVLMLIGVICLATSMIPRTLENYHPSSLTCVSELWLVNIGYSLIIGTLLLKTYRLSEVFRMSKCVAKHHLTDYFLLTILFGLILLSSGMLAGLCFGDPFYLQVSPLDTANDYQYCTSKHQLTMHFPLILSTRFALLLLTTIWAYRIRKIPDLFNETRQLVFTVYNLFFLSIALPTIDLTMGRGKELAATVYGICTYLICILTALIMFIPKIISMITMKERRNSTSSTFTFSLANVLPFTHKQFVDRDSKKTLRDRASTFGSQGSSPKYASSIHRRSC